MVGHAKSQDQKQRENSQNHEEAIAYGIELHREDKAKPENE